MSTTTSSDPLGTFTPPSSPPGNNPPPPNDQPKSSSLYLFTFLSTLFLLLVVSSAIVLRSFLLRRRYNLQLQEQLDDIFRPPRDAPGAASRKKNFGAKPKLWDTWIRSDDLQDNPVNELSGIKPLSVTYVPQEIKASGLSSTTPRSPSQERRNERSAVFLASLFANPLPRHPIPIENDHPGVDSASPSAEISRTVQVSVVISMPTPYHRKPPVSHSGEEEFPNVAIGFTRLPTTDN